MKVNNNVKVRSALLTDCLWLYCDISNYSPSKTLLFLSVWLYIFISPIFPLSFHSAFSFSAHALNFGIFICLIFFLVQTRCSLPRCHYQSFLSLDLIISIHPQLRVWIWILLGILMWLHLSLLVFHWYKQLFQCQATNPRIFPVARVLSPGVSWGSPGNLTWGNPRPDYVCHLVQELVQSVNFTFLYTY